MQWTLAGGETNRGWMVAITGREIRGDGGQLQKTDGYLTIQKYGFMTLKCVVKIFFGKFHGDVNHQISGLSMFNQYLMGY